MDRKTYTQEEILLRNLVMFLEWLGNQVRDLQERVERLEARGSCSCQKREERNPCRYPS